MIVSDAFDQIELIIPGLHSTVRNLNPRLISNRLLRVDANRVGMGIGPNENYSADRQTTDFPLARTVKRVANASQHEVATNHAVICVVLQKYASDGLWPDILARI